MQNEKPEIVLLKDSDWSIVDDSFCKVIDFSPLSILRNGEVIGSMDMPYASIRIECTKLPKIAKGFITHKIDFIHLWYAFKERTISQNEEVLIIWSIKHYKSWITKLLSAIMPKLWVMVCKKDAYKLWTDKSYKPELTGETRFLAQMPITEWKPEVIE